MSKLKNKNDLLTQGKGRFKPLIATSLVLALGVSANAVSKSYDPYINGNDKYGIYNSEVWDSTTSALKTYTPADGDIFVAIDAVSADPAKSGNAYGIKQYSASLTLNNGVTFNSVKGVNARGINTAGTKRVVVLGGVGKTIAFTEIVGTNSAYGIDNASSVTNAAALNEGQLTFSKILGTKNSIGFQNTGNGTGLKVGDSKAATLTFTKIGGTDANASSGSAYGMLFNGTATNMITVNGQGTDTNKAKILFTDILATKTAVGIMHKQGSTSLDVGQYGDITFSSITSTGASAIGIQSNAGNTITLGATSGGAGAITFSKIETSATSGSGSSMGVYTTKNTTLNIYGAVEFSSITSTTNDAIGAYSTKDSASAQGELKIDVKANGSLAFADISSTSATTSGDAYGLKASNKLHLVNASNTGIAFTKIYSKSNFAYGLRSREIVIENNNSNAITFGSIVAEGVDTANVADASTAASVVGIMLDGGKTVADGSEITNLSLKGSVTFTSLSAPCNEYVIYAKQSSTSPDVSLKITTIGASTITAAGTNNLVGIATTGTTKIDTTSSNTLTLDLQGKSNGTTSVTGLRAMGGSFELSSDGLQLKVGETTNTAKAYGVKLEDGSISGNLAFNGINSWVKVKDAANNVAYGVHTSGTSTINGTIRFASNALADGTHSKAYTLYNEGNLTLNGSSKIVVGTDTASANANIYAAENQVANIVMQSGSTTTFNGATAFGVGRSDVTRGKINFSLQTNDANQGAKLVFNGDAGALNTLSGSNAEIFLAGGNAEAVNARFNAKAGFARRTLTVEDMQLSNSHIVLAAKSDMTDQVNPSIIVSDTIAAATKSVTQIDNTLHVMVDSYKTEADGKVAILAVTDANSKLTFNGLNTDGTKTNATTYSGFTNGDIEIQRISEGNKTYYISNLVSTNISVNTDFVAPTTAALSAGVSVFSANLNSLSKRMGELRNDPYASGVWARVFAGEQTTDFGAKQSTVYSTFQAGYDYKLALEDASNYIGLALSYTKGAGGQVDPVVKYAPAPLGIPVAGLSSSNTDGVEVALYNSYVANSGLYSDTIVKAGYYMTDLTMFMQPDTYSTSNLAVAVSEEIGYKVKLGESNEWFITPQGEVAFAYMGGTEFAQDYGNSSLKSTQDATSFLRARVGAAWGYNFSHLAKESDIKALLYVGTYYTYDYFIGGDTTLSTTASGKAVEYKHNAYEGTGRFVMNLGTNIDVKDSTKVYVDFEKSFGGSIQTDYQISLGVRFGFGEKVSAPKPEEKQSSEAILKPKELEENIAG